MPQSVARQALTKLAARAGRFLGVTDVARRTDELAELQHALADLQRTMATQMENVLHWQLQLQLARSVFLMSTYLGSTPLTEDELVSVVMPTRNRAAVIGDAIASVQAQSYTNWELVVVDDGSTDSTLEVVARFGDPRIRVLCTSHRGAAAARNLALDEVCGNYVVYLDDDNIMHEHWLRGVVWGFRGNHDADVLVGARLLDDLDRSLGKERGNEPWLIVVHEWNRAELADHNLGDTMQIAHRAGLSERFDEELLVCADWDFVARLTQDQDPVCLPVLAGIYTTTASGRLMDSERLVLEMELLRERLASKQPPRPSDERVPG